MEENITHFNNWCERYSLQVGTFCTDSCNWSHCRHKFLKRCRCIGTPTADIFGRPRVRSSRLASTICGRTGRRRIWVNQQCLQNNPRSTFSTSSSETQNRIQHSSSKKTQRYFICVVNAGTGWRLDHMRQLKKYDTPKHAAVRQLHTRHAMRIASLSFVCLSP